MVAACPAHVDPVAPDGVAAASRALLRMLPTLAARVSPALDLHGARVLQARRVRSGDIAPATACPAALRRSILVHVFLPAERSAPSLRGNPVWYLARTRGRWVAWFQAH